MMTPSSRGLFDRTLLAMAFILIPIVAWRFQDPALADASVSQDGVPSWTADPLLQPMVPVRWNGRNLFREVGLFLDSAIIGEEVPSLGDKYRPSLELQALVGGPPWTAVVRGIPGRSSATVLGVGDQADSLTVVAIDVRGVQLKGPDTTWFLQLDRGRQ